MQFSLIIPVYNVIQYLNRCLESVLAQTFMDYEVIIVDDGSTDGSGAVCDEFRRRAPGWKVVHRENKGLASARNEGLRMATGEYVFFLDSDDYIEKEFLMKTWYALSTDAYDACSFGVRRIDHVGEYLYEMRFDKSIGAHAISSEEKARFLCKEFLQYQFGWEAWVFVFRKKMIDENKLQFHEDIAYAEDLPFTFAYMLHANRIIKLPDILYNYTVREHSITSEIDFERHIHGIFGLNYEIMHQAASDFFEKKGLSADILIYCSMMLYFIPRYLEKHTISDINKQMLMQTWHKEMILKALDKKQQLKDIFDPQVYDTVMTYIRQFAFLLTS